MELKLSQANHVVHTRMGIIVPRTTTRGQRQSKLHSTLCVLNSKCYFQFTLQITECTLPLHLSSSRDM